MATLLGAWRAGMAAAAAPLATSAQNALASLNDRAKAECLAQLVNDIKKKGNNTAIIIDEANLALPNDGNNAKAETAKTALAQITGETKEAFTASVVLISSEHGYPFKLAKAGLNLVDIKNIIIAPEVPPVDMFEMLTDHWGMGHRLARLFVATYGGIIPREAQKPGLWPDVFHETDEKYVLVASTHHVRLLICEALLNKGYIQNSGGNLA
eukprot:s361_g1.t1